MPTAKSRSSTGIADQTAQSLRVDTQPIQRFRHTLPGIRRAYLDLRKSLEPSRVMRPSLVDLIDDLRLVLSVVDEAYDVLKDPTRRERYRRAISHEPPG